MPGKSSEVNTLYENNLTGSLMQEVDFVVQRYGVKPVLLATAVIIITLKSA
ncbi:hypothetical protein yruck0001_13390 [Yersinia ruckeri ATCC 29473]|nr:hypothetical protein yruck0001_13390 [Yersinia ruckeri ATCC 29473]